MQRTLIVAKITPGAEAEVARIFAASDRTDLPRVAGVSHRSLYRLGDLYVHLLETEHESARVLADVRGQEEFGRVTEQLAHFIQPYLPTWRSPRDAVARCFYTYEPDGSPGGRAVTGTARAEA
ncbi:polyketide synthesis cyclase [Candidatus Protofrankia californiensis]|uniref:Polyketide synthesis cyclase n=1 Tax=Candidatus Protofrankia californiensis TaxID=1839754 RepID=A0A1C3P029_9ACTN|nr:polyketide synthesis cyclase [Candidatus Protofrankia californiensis]